MGICTGKAACLPDPVTVAGAFWASLRPATYYLSSPRPGLLRGPSAERLAVRFSVVVPLHRVTPAVHRLLEAIEALDYDDFELLVVSDAPIDLPPCRGMRVITTGATSDTSPAEKRDVAAIHATGAALAYIDDDAYPAPDWLTVAGELLSDSSVHAVGGPGLTPPGSGFRERVGGAVYESPLGSGPLAYRFSAQSARVIDDYPAYNLIVRTDAVRLAGGWASTLYGGEDTVFCRRLADCGAPVHYDPRLVVFHHRRPVFRAHMRQVHNVGRHRGNFLRTGDPSSRQAVFLLGPASVVASVLWLIRSLLGGSRRQRAAVAAAAVTAALACPDKDPRVRLVFPFGLLAHHVAYTWGFISGVLTRRIVR